MKKLPPSFVFDDLVGVLTSNSKFFKNFITTFRHLNINVIICVQDLVAGISTTVRAQINYCLMYNEKNNRTLDILYKNFGGLFPSREDFISGKTLG